MTRRAVHALPQTYARIGGVLYVFIVAVGIFGFVVRGGLVEPGDAAATADNIMDAETLFRATLAAELLGYVSSVAVAAILYALLRPVNRDVALLAAFLTATANAVYGLNGLFQLAAVMLLGGAGTSDLGADPSPTYLQAFDPPQLHALAYLLLRLHAYGFAIGSILFGFALVLLGYLIRRSGYLPKAIGVLLVVAGAGYLANSFAQILDPDLAGSLVPWVLLPAFLAESGLALWLAIKGVDGPTWDERAQRGWATAD